MAWFASGNVYSSLPEDDPSNCCSLDDARVPEPCIELVQSAAASKSRTVLLGASWRRPPGEVPVRRRALVLYAAKEGRVWLKSVGPSPHLTNPQLSAGSAEPSL